MMEEKENREEMPADEAGKKRSWKDHFGIGAIIGIVVGAIGGYLYYYFIGCRSGSCPINSNPYISTLWGALIGYLLGDMFRFRKKKSL